MRGNVLRRHPHVDTVERIGQDGNRAVNQPPVAEHGQLTSRDTLDVPPNLLMGVLAPLRRTIFSWLIILPASSKVGGLPLSACPRLSGGRTWQGSSRYSGDSALNMPLVHGSALPYALDTDVGGRV